ncbi:MAG: aminoacetone oxidase family FAD-binding enzyme [Clostridia bacterium]|nr:aminoacetone oxidase family FAD-binding enzyme [Clostridia bacterium]
MPYDVIILGGGASGLMAGCLLAKEGFSVVLAEKDERIGRKLLATGNGRCNLGNTDLSERHFYGDLSLLPGLICEGRVRRTEEIFRDLGLPIRRDSAGRLYPSSFQASAVVDVFRYTLNALGCTVRTGFKAVRAFREAGIWNVLSESGERIRGFILLAAMGGCAGPKQGGSMDGYALLRNLGHTMRDPVPALAPLLCEKQQIRGLKGIRLPAELHLCAQNGKVLRCEEGEVLFTEYGLSGICAMQLSYSVQCLRQEGTQCTVEMDLFPDREKQEIQSILASNRDKYAREDITVLFAGLVPRMLALRVLEISGIPVNQSVGVLTDEQIRILADRLKGLPFTVTGTQGFAMAQIAAGGADHTQIEPQTLASRIQKDLYVAGELIHLHGDCGGYNLYLCWSSASVVAEAVTKRLREIRA